MQQNTVFHQDLQYLLKKKNDKRRKNTLVLQILTRFDFFYLFDSLRPINNLSVKQGRVFLG